MRNRSLYTKPLSPRWQMQSGGENYNCECKEPYSGGNCDSSPCVSHPCQNNGKCVIDEHGYKCECTSPFKGIFCENGPCSSNPCQHAGVCKVQGQTFKCECRQPYSGKKLRIGSMYTKFL
ncbi:hypothetical protein CEXT_51151 [Caerostris extrusa]|uniref:EGF-like domain-containing protein n=1 Tax=Caerostris extrusa TaxID=172846 RepID=A0AAV4RUZ4_CAEEX|nr:hypothetical protein CEXT_51151 [Caerostris extrusa]